MEKDHTIFLIKFLTNSSVTWVFKAYKALLLVLSINSYSDKFAFSFWQAVILQLSLYAPK